VQRAEPEAHLLGREEVAGADTAHGFERAHRVAQVEQERATDDHVEGADRVRAELVDRHLAALGRGAERLLGDSEADPLVLAHPLGRALGPLLAHVRGPVPVARVRDVDRDHLGRAAALELEREEAVVGADVETTFAAHVRPGHLVDHGPQVEPAGRRDARRELDRVVPGRVRVDRGLQVRRVGGHRYGTIPSTNGTSSTFSCAIGPWPK
jgi:hypothetical protein